MPLQDADIILLERFLDYYSGLICIVVLLELPIVDELELLHRLHNIFLKDLDVILLLKFFWILTGFPCALLREAAP